jgi:hypothetical protein
MQKGRGNAAAFSVGAAAIWQAQKNNGPLRGRCCIS